MGGFPAEGGSWRGPKKCVPATALPWPGPKWGPLGPIFLFSREQSSVISQSGLTVRAVRRTDHVRTVNLYTIFGKNSRVRHQQFSNWPEVPALTGLINRPTVLPLNCVVHTERYHNKVGPSRGRTYEAQTLQRSAKSSDTGYATEIAALQSGSQQT